MLCIECNPSSCFLISPSFILCFYSLCHVFLHFAIYNAKFQRRYVFPWCYLKGFCVVYKEEIFKSNGESITGYCSLVNSVRLLCFSTSRLVMLFYHSFSSLSSRLSKKLVLFCMKCNYLGHASSKS